MSKIPLLDLLANKRNGVKEVHLILFEQCNLTCSFCHQNHDSTLGMNTVVADTAKVISALDPNVGYKFTITGGELFHDGISDKLFDDYAVAIRMVLDKLPKSRVVLGTNLIFDPTRLVALLDDLDTTHLDRVSIATSYDPAGRFNARQAEQFMEVIHHPGLINRICTVNVVITKQNIDAILSGKHRDNIDRLYRSFGLYFDHFMANDDYSLYQPTEERILEFFLFLKEHYPNAGPIRDMANENYGELTCQSTIIFTDDGQKVTCWGEAGKDRTMDYEEGLRRKNAAEIDFMEYYGCLSCEYYRRCTMRCFLHHHSLEERPKECQIKLLYDAL